MKFFAAIVASAAAVSLNDAPPYFNEPTWRQTWPSAAGFVQLDQSQQVSACQKSGIAGVTCGPADSELFAVGMNGDEDLGQEITMKGQKFKYNQKSSLVQLSQAPFPQYEALAPEKVLVPQTTHARYHTSYY